MDKTLEAIISAVPTFRATFPFDCMIAISDQEKFIFYLPGIKMKHESPIGKPIKQGDGLWEAINNKQTYTNVISKEIWGFPFKNISTPVFNEHKEIVGAFGLAYSLENQEILINAAHTIASSSQEVLASSEELLKNATILHNKMDNLREASKLMLRKIEQSNQILSFIKEVAYHTNILGLNAAIEAARAGKSGNYPIEVLYR
ncbi:methyl-accepting chemotaxis protein [Moorella sulfitireducens]|uniref:methyl-accepting chemotaxis protein n=1 Tax=Neomoorella sulfitireducens TaxID=2972948 RepID=UPI00241416FB|nr:methyl-accepting chemotaxis protein [Moorella sulfitireducens]